MEIEVESEAATIINQIGVVCSKPYSKLYKVCIDIYLMALLYTQDRQIKKYTKIYWPSTILSNNSRKKVMFFNNIIMLCTGGDMLWVESE